MRLGSFIASPFGLGEMTLERFLVELNHYRHCEERKRRSNPVVTLISGLLRGACHRAGHFGPGPLARNDALI
jgi:hypothetical protein